MGLIEWIGAILGGIAINLVANELFAWGPRLSKWLTSWAVRQLPVEMQERMREEWVGHLDVLHPLSRNLAAIGFVLAACRIRVSFDREARGALTLREWLAPKPIVVVVLSSTGARKLSRLIGEVLDSEGRCSRGLEFSPEDGLMRSNLRAKAQQLLHRARKRMLRSNGKEPQLAPDACAKISRRSSSELAFESAAGVLLFKLRQTINR